MQIRLRARVAAQRRAVVDDTRIQAQLNGRGRRGRYRRFRRLCRRHLSHFRRRGHLRRCRRFGRRGFGRYRSRGLGRRGRFRRLCRRGRRRVGARFRIVDGSDIRRFLLHAHQLDVIGHHVTVAAVGANIAPIAFAAHDPNHRTGRKPRDFLAVFVRLFTERNLSARVVAIVVNIALRQLLRNGFRRRGGRRLCRRFGRRGLNRRDSRLRRLNGSLRFLLRNEADVVALYISGISVGHVANQIPELSVFARRLRGNLQRRRAADCRNRAARRVRRIGRGAQDDERILLNRHGIRRERHLAGLLGRLLDGLLRRLLGRLFGRLLRRFGRRFHARQQLFCLCLRNRRHEEVAHIAGHAVADNRHVVPAVIDNLVDEQQLAVRIFAQNGGSRVVHLTAQVVGASAAGVVGHGILHRRLCGFFRGNRRFFDDRFFRRDRRLDNRFLCRNRRLDNRFFRRNRRLDDRLFRRNRRLDDRLLRRDRRSLRCGGFGVDLRHQNLSGGFVHARHLFSDDPSVFHRAIVRNLIPETARFVKHIAVDKQHITRIQRALGIPFVRAKEEHRFRLVDRRIQRKLNRRLCRRFFCRNRRFLDNRLFRGNRRFLDDRFFRRNRRFLDNRLFRRNRRFLDNRLFRRSRRFKAELTQHGVGFPFGHRRGIAGTHERQSGGRIERIDHRYRVIQRILQSRSGKGHFAVNLSRIRHQPELCVRERGALFVRKHTVIKPIDGAAQRRRHGRHIQTELAAVPQRNDDLNRQPCAFGRHQLLRLRHRRGQQHGTEREGCHPADESLHHDCILLFR